MRGTNDKQEIKSVAIFGSNGRIGRPVAQYISRHKPDTELRLIVRSDRHRESLEKEFPNAKVVIANYYDLQSLEQALRGVQGVFVVTPDFLDEERAMTNLVYAARRNRGLIQIVRLVADPPGMTLDRVPDIVKKFGGGTAMQHMIAKKVLMGSGLPITYINIGAYFMQNFVGPLFHPALRDDHTLACPRDRRMGFIDTDDIGYCAGAILLSDDHRHIGQIYHLDNGNDVMWFSDVAELMTKTWGVEIAYDGTDEGYIKRNGEMFNKLFGRTDAAEYFIGFSQFEQDNQCTWRKSDIVEYLTGNKANTLENWLRENKQSVLSKG